MNAQRPRLSRIALHDWPALAGLIGLPVNGALFLVYFIARSEEGKPDLFLPVFATSIALILLALIAWRIGRIQRLFRSGIEVPGRVTDLRLVRDRGRLEFEFLAGERRIDAWMPVHKTRRVIEFQPGRDVTVLYDRAHPRRAIVRDLFL